MKLKYKNIIAREILIFSSIVILAIIIYGILHLLKKQEIEEFKSLQNQEVELINKIKVKETLFISEYGVKIINPNQKLFELYDRINQKYKVSYFDDFKSKMVQEQKRKLLYQTIKEDFELGTFEEFEKI